MKSSSIQKSLYDIILNIYGEYLNKSRNVCRGQILHFEVAAIREIWWYESVGHFLGEELKLGVR
jgi:hypothetical protein